MSDSDTAATLARLETVIRQRLEADPEESYVAALCAGTPDRLLKKISEEATEVILASASGETPADDEAVANESADLVFHLLVLLARRGMGFDQVASVLAAREGVSGLQEKQLRSPANTR